jgi:PTS system mannose-specific IID component
MGASFISSVSGQLTAFTEAASILGLFVVGAMIPNTVSVSTGLTFTYGEVSLPIQTGVLDLIFPCLLPALLTWLVYTLLKRGVKMVYIIFGIIIVGWIGAATGILV